MGRKPRPLLPRARGASRRGDKPPAGKDPPPIWLPTERLTIALGWLVFSGFIYIQAFLQDFNLSIFDANIAPSSFVYYSFRPALGLVFSFFDGVWILVLAAIVVGVLGALAFSRLRIPDDARLLLTVAAAFVFAYCLAQHVARLDALGIARGGGTMVQFAFAQSPDLAGGAIPNAACGIGLPDDGAAEVTVATAPLFSAKDVISADLSQANECRQLRLIWRTQSSAIVVRAYPKAFCPCSAGDDDPDDDIDYRPAYCLAPANADAIQVPETYAVPFTHTGVVQATRMDARSSTDSLPFSRPRRPECS